MSEQVRDEHFDVPLWGAQAIGQHINRKERQVFWLLENGKLDATKVGNVWVSTRRRLNRSLGMEAA